MSRSLAREQAFIFLYQISVQQDDVEAQLERFQETLNLGEADLTFFNTLVAGVRAHREALIEVIRPCLRRWAFERLPRIDQTILELAAFELLFGHDAPPNAVISEAVLLARKYSGEEARSYVNGVLASILKQHAEN